MNVERMVSLYLLRCASQEGVDRDDVPPELCLPRNFFENASDQQTADSIPQLVATLVRMTNNGQFAFNAGRNIHPCLLGPAGLAATYAPTLADLFKTFAELGGHNSRWGRLIQKPDRSSTVWSLDLNKVNELEHRRQTAVMWATTMVSFGRLVIGERFHATRIGLQEELSFDRSTLEDYFRCPLTMGAEQNDIEIDNLFLLTQSRISDPHLFDQLVFSATALKKRHDGVSTVEAVDEIISRGFFDLESVAAEIGITERTVQRRLKDEQTTFQGRLDVVRLKLAEIYLPVPGLTVEEIAARLGFSGDKAFRTAYRRWTGRSPRETE